MRGYGKRSNWILNDSDVDHPTRQILGRWPQPAARQALSMEAQSYHPLSTDRRLDRIFKPSWACDMAPQAIPLL